MGTGKDARIVTPLGRRPEMRTIKTTTGARIVLDGDLMAVMDALYREVTARREFDRTFDDINLEIAHLIAQMTEPERRAYLHEALFLNTVAYENQRVAAYVLRMTGERRRSRTTAARTATRRSRR
jgi:hypothetical protein